MLRPLCFAVALTMMPLTSAAAADTLYGGAGKDGVRKMIPTRDGGFVMVGWADQKGVHETGTGVVVSVDATGTQRWQATLETSGRNQLSSVLQRADGSYVVALEEYPSDSDLGQVVLFELSATGEVLAQHAVGGPGNDVADTVLQTADGGYVLGGESAATKDGSLEAWVAKLSPAFEMEWEWRDGTPGRDRFNDLILLADGSVIAAGNATTPREDGRTNEQAWWIKLDAGGTLVWSRKKTEGRAASVRSIAPTADGGFVFAGFSKRMEDRSFDAWIGRADADGGTLWQSSLPHEGGDYLHSVTAGGAHDFVAAGAHRPSGATEYDGLVIEFTAGGETMDVTRHGGVGSEQAREVVPTAGSGFVLAGAAKTSGSDDEQMWFYRSAETLPFTAVQTDLFAAPGAQSNIWGDYDNDGDLDLLVTFRRASTRLYQNTDGVFTDVAAAMGLPTEATGGLGDMRGAAWGDYDNDGDLDLYLGYAGRADPRNRLYRNDGDTFTEVGEAAGVDLKGITGQTTFVDHDGDGDLDLYVAFRETFNRMLENNGDGTFTDISFRSGLAEIRRTVGACWFDMDGDGDLDVFTANQNGDRDGMFRKDGARYTDVAMELDMDQPRRPTRDGSVGCAVTDFDTDGDIDLYVAEYGHDSLFRNNGDGTFTDVAEQMGVDVEDHIVTGIWGDVNNDGRPDLYTVGYVSRQPGAQDYLFLNRGDHFEDVLPGVMAARDSDHGVQFADFDGDGDLDIAMASNDATGSHYVFANDLPGEATSRSLQVLVLDRNGHYTKAGSQVRVYRAGTDTLLGMTQVDTGSGYKTQNAMPVHFGLPDLAPVDIVVSTPSPSGPRMTRRDGVDPQALAGRIFELRTED